MEMAIMKVPVVEMTVMKTVRSHHATVEPAGHHPAMEPARDHAAMEPAATPPLGHGRSD